MGCCCSNSDNQKDIKIDPFDTRLEIMRSPHRIVDGKVALENTAVDFEEIWKKFDKDDSGTLEKNEAYCFIEHYMTELTGRQPTKRDLENNFFMIDRDGSGDIDKREALDFLY